MSSTERAAQLRALADHLDTIGSLEATAEDAAETYRDDIDDPQAKDKHREAQDALRSARQQARESGVMVASSQPGSVAIQPGTVAGKAAN